MEERKELLLQAYNQTLPEGKEISLDEAKGRNIFYVRKKLNKSFGTKLVLEVFGPPDRLEKAQKSLVEAQKTKDFKRKFEKLQETAKYLRDFTFMNFSSTDILRKKCSYYEDCIQVNIVDIKKTQKTGELCSVPDVISMGALKKIIHNWKKGNCAEDATIEYLLNLVEVSLERTFEEISRAIR